MARKYKIQIDFKFLNATYLIWRTVLFKVDESNKV